MKPLVLKCIVYSAVAALTAISTDLQHVKDISALQSGEILQMIVKMLLSIVIAIKAYLDPTSGQSIEDATSSTSEENTRSEEGAP